MNAYFVYDCYEAAGRPKAEQAVMAYAKANYLHLLIHASRLEDVVNDLKKYMNKILEENKRLSAVDISLADESWYGHRTLHIGQQSLRLRRVKDFIDKEVER